MNNQIVRFENRDDIRIINDSELGVLFCAKDVCDVLGYANSRKAISDNCNQSGVTTSYISYPSGKKLATFINEANLYRLTMRSKLEGAVTFQDWIVEEVLPSIRKTGSYVDDQQRLTTLTHQEIHDNLIGQTQRLREQYPTIEVSKSGAILGWDSWDTEQYAVEAFDSKGLPRIQVMERQNKRHTWNVEVFFSCDKLTDTQSAYFEKFALESKGFKSWFTKKDAFVNRSQACETIEFKANEREQALKFAEKLAAIRI